jgi:pilus assembly protein CpaB
MNSNKRWIGVVAAVVLAALGTFILIQYVNSADQRALAGQETIQVYVLQQPIEAGTPAEELTATVETALIPAATQVPGTVASLDQIAGTVAAVDLVPGEQLLVSRFIQPEVFAEQDDFVVPDGLVEVTVSLSPERAVGGALRPGDLVAVMGSFEPFDLDGTEPTDDDLNLPSDVESVLYEESGNENPQTPNTTGVLFQKVVVTNVQVERLPTEPAEGEDASQYDLAPTGNLLVTLGMEAANAERIVFTAEYGTLWLAGEQETTPDGGTQLQTRISVYDEPLGVAR